MQYFLLSVLCFVFGCGSQYEYSYPEYEYSYSDQDDGLNISFDMNLPKKEEEEKKKEEELPPPPPSEEESGQAVQSNEIILAETETAIDDVKSSNTIAVIDFGAVWCQPCKALYPEMEKIAEENFDVSFWYADIEKNTELRNAAGNILSVPTVIVYKQGEEVGRVVGNNPEKVRELIAQARL